MTATPAAAVDSAVLFHLSKSGGLNTGADLTRQRLTGMQGRGELDATTVYALMLDAATRAAEESTRRARSLQGSIAHSLTRMNEDIDSARLARFIDTLNPARPTESEIQK